MDKDTFVKRAIAKYGNFYDYSKVPEHFTQKDKICIICPEHGEFWQVFSGHLRNSCPKCANKRRGKKFTKEEFLERAKKVHGDKYDYSKVEYINCETNVCIICQKHGEFWQTPVNHILGHDCPKCKGRGLNTKEIVKKFKEVHGDKYDYSKVEFVKMHEKVCIICHEHGEFWQTPSKHLIGRGCPKCGKMSAAKKQCVTKEEFVERARKIHGEKYIYDNVNYEKMALKVEIICPKHGVFLQRPYDNLFGHACPKCANIESKAECEIYDFVCDVIGKDNVIRNDRTVLEGKEIDILIPSMNWGIEYNGLLWHSEKYGKDNRYHLDKLNKCNEKGIRLIQIFEDEYLNHKEIVLEKIRHILGKSEGEKISARKCTVYEISSHESKDFMEKYHIQGGSNASVYLGCFYNGNMIGSMSFLSNSEDKWELTRFASDFNYICRGVGGKLLNYFIKKYNPSEIKSFADRRWTIDIENNIYTKTGFNIENILNPDYSYIDSNNPIERFHKFNFRKSVLNKRYGLSMKLTETEMTESLGYCKIWNCGLIKYVWKK